MNATKLLLGTAAGTVALFALDFLGYGVLLKNTFTIVEGYHSEFPDWMPYVIGLIVFAFFFTYIYSKGVDSGGSKMQQGMRYGLLIGLMVGIGLGMIYYSLQTPIGISEYLIDGAFTVVKLAIVGIVVAFASGVPGADNDRGKAEGGGGGGGV